MGFALACASPLACSLSWLLGARSLRPALAILAGVVSMPVFVLVWASASALAPEIAPWLSPLYFVILFAVAAVLLSVAGVLAGAVSLLGN